MDYIYEKAVLKVSQLVLICACCGTARFVTVFTKGRCFLPRLAWIQSTLSHPPCKICFNIVMPSTCRPRRHYVMFVPEYSCISHFSHASYFTCPRRLPWFYHRNKVWWSITKILIISDLLWAGRSGDRIPAEANFRHASRLALGLTQSPIQWVPDSFRE